MDNLLKKIIIENGKGRIYSRKEILDIFKIDKRRPIEVKYKGVDINPCFIEGYGEIDLGFFRGAQNLKTGIVPVDEMRLAAFGLTKEEFMKGIKELAKTFSIGLLVASPIVFMNLEKIIGANPSIAQEVQIEKENYINFKQRLEDKLRKDPEYNQSSDEDLDKIVLNSYKMLSPELSKEAMDAESFLNQGPIEDLLKDQKEDLKEKEEDKDIEKKEVPSRGKEAIRNIDGKETRGYFIDRDTINSLKNETDNVLSTLAPWFDDEQREFFKKFFEEIGLAESCYGTSEGVFSIEKQVRGPALGFVQIETPMAISVLNEVSKGSPEYAKTMNTRIQDTLGMDIPQAIETIKGNPRKMLNNNRVSFVVFYLQFANKGFSDIPGFKEGEISNYSHFDRAKLWKKVWNTSEGSGKVKDYIERNRINSRLI